jgi:hypothetical protein
VAAQWALPACINGLVPFVDPTMTHLVLVATVGYGVGPPCGEPPGQPVQTSLNVLALNGAAIQTIARFPGTNAINVVGW